MLIPYKKIYHDINTLTAVATVHIGNILESTTYSSWFSVESAVVNWGEKVKYTCEVTILCLFVRCVYCIPDFNFGIKWPMFRTVGKNIVPLRDKYHIV